MAQVHRSRVTDSGSCLGFLNHAQLKLALHAPFLVFSLFSLLSPAAPRLLLLSLLQVDGSVVFSLLSSVSPLALSCLVRPCVGVRMQKHGPYAWENYGSDYEEIFQARMARLLILSISAATNAQWIPKVRSFLYFCMSCFYPLETAEDVHLAFLAYLDYLCYKQEVNVSVGSMER